MLIIIFTTLAVAIGINLLAFLVSFVFKRDTLIDITYVATFLIILMVTMILTRAHHWSHFLFMTLIVIGALRLGIFLGIRICKYKTDRRFNNIRHSFGKFGLFGVLQAISTGIVSIPAYFMFTISSPHINPSMVISVFFAFVFICWEALADYQKYVFKLHHSGQFIKTGLGKISRHPNYFGEIGFGIMIACFTLASNPKALTLLAFFSPAGIALIICKISGVPILEKQAGNQFQHDPQYIAYLHKTPCIIPFIGQKGSKFLRR